MVRPCERRHQWIRRQSVVRPVPGRSVHGLGDVEQLASPGLRFDPYPYGLLTFIVSLEGVLIATFVLITQNRMAAQSDQRDHLICRSTCSPNRK